MSVRVGEALRRIWPLVALLLIVLAVSLAASLAPTVLQRRATLALINLVAVVGLYVFVGTVIGGLGNLAGAAIGGFLVGAVTILLQALLPPDLRVFREAFVYIAVTLVLLFRPQGLFPARSLKERV